MRSTEKPAIELAKEYLKSKEYLWNSGMFVWKVSTILSNFQKYMPDTWSGLKNIQKFIGLDKQEEILERNFSEFEPISIDYGIMEKAEKIYILPGEFGWDDVGSWLAVGRIRASDEYGNVADGDIITIDCKNTIIQGNKKLIAAIGIQDLIIIDTEDATLICNKENTADIKKVLEYLKESSRNEYI